MSKPNCPVCRHHAHPILCDCHRQGGDADAESVDSEPEHGPDASRVEAGGPQSAAAGAEPWPSDEAIDDLIDRIGLERFASFIFFTSAEVKYQGLEIPGGAKCVLSDDGTFQRHIRAWLATIPPLPAHRAALERAEKAEAALAVTRTCLNTFGTELARSIESAREVGAKRTLSELLRLKNFLTSEVDI